MNEINTLSPKLKKAVIYITLLLFILQIFLSSAVVSEATLYKRPAPVQTSEVRSYAGDYLPEEYFTVRTPQDEKSVIYVSGHVRSDVKRLCIRLAKHNEKKYFITSFVTPDRRGDFSVKIDTSIGNTSAPLIIDGKGTAAKASDCRDTRPGYRAVERIGEGTYHLTIAAATTNRDADISNDADPAWYKGTLGGSSDKGYIYKESILTIKKGHDNDPKLVKYTSAVTNNKKIRNMYEPGSYLSYRDKYMKDIAFVFKDPKTGKMSPLTSSRVAYVKKIADSITSGSSSDMEKLEKIYEYVSGNIYYDRLAFEKGQYQYSNPYLNLYNMRNKIKSANSSNGRVATTCQGYASMVVALARSQGIPARLIHGHHISQPIKIWSDKTDKEVSRSTHWWAEAYIQGRWIVIDANAATYNRWDRTSFSSSGSWTYSGTATYAFFDPSDEILASSYSYNEIYKGSTDGKNAGYEAETDKIKAFLSLEHNGISNGKRLNKNYSPDNKSTWGTGRSNNFLTNGYGRIAQISWDTKKLYGKMDLSGMSALTSLKVNNNNLTSLDLTGCSSIRKIDASYNSIRNFDTSLLTKVTSIDMRGNRLTSAKIRVSSKKITFTSSTSKCSFGLKYSNSASKKVTLYANKVSGYKYLGVYSSSGKKLSSKSTYTLTPSQSRYVIRYKKL